MRKYAIIKQPNEYDYKKIIIYDCEHGTYFFPCTTTEDEGGIGDDWYESVEEADKVAFRDYGIAPSDWIHIDDPLPYCQTDFIRPVRIPGREEGNIQWGTLEEFKDGQWVFWKTYET